MQSITINIISLVSLCLVAISPAYAQCGNRESGDCCAVNSTTGCDDLACCEIVCDILPACCVWPWDNNCAFLANIHCLDACAACGGGSQSNNPCCSPNDTPYCYDESCCASVCDMLPACCEDEWDQSCADMAWKLCPDLDGCSEPPVCGSGTGSCCFASGTPGCVQVACCETVCDLSPACCEEPDGWNLECVDLAVRHCDGVCACGASGDCCSAGGTPFCNDAACCEAVCAIDPYCCEVGGKWDACCANLAFEHCPHPRAPEQSICEPPPACGRGPCCVSHDTPGCEDGECCEIVCGNDPFCCDIQWDSLCADAAHEAGCCIGSPPVPAAFSCEGNCGGAALSGCWCDEACCHFGDCCQDKGMLCPGCDYLTGPPQYFGDWCGVSDCGGTSFGGCGCDEGCFERGDCCSTVCWDCPELGGCVDPNPADLTGNGRAEVDELLIILNNWGECEFERCLIMEPCLGDYNHDGWINVDDLLFLLNNWG